MKLFHIHRSICVCGKREDISTLAVNCPQKFRLKQWNPERTESEVKAQQTSLHPAAIRNRAKGWRSGQ